MEGRESTRLCVPVEALEHGLLPETNLQVCRFTSVVVRRRKNGSLRDAHHSLLEPQRGALQTRTLHYDSDKPFDLPRGQLHKEPAKSARLHRQSV